ncbi:MAG: DNA replication/repair protein RecF [Ruminococcaceae bacterium]|nr:DNA replication/repair protein RecF [Oscillospiraceae bacterium]
MKITRLNLSDFRNLQDVEFIPDEGINVIYGENGQGKTNIIEAIWLFTGFKSFRTRKNSEMIPYEKEKYEIEMDYFSENREQNIKFISDISKQETYKNGIKMVSPRSIIGEFFSVVFSPAHLNLIKGGPDEKRRFLDIAISQLKPSYARMLSDYVRSLKQRNALLKNFNDTSYEYDMLDCWDETISTLGGKITAERIKYTDALTESAIEIYDGISNGREILNIKYNQVGREDKFEEKDIIFSLSDALKKSRENDIKNKFTSKGPHRDDFDVILNSKNIKNFGSQGQQRSAALSLKLAEASLIKKINDEQPVALLDDVMSELDTSRQDYILNKLKDWQVFISCCEPTQVLRMQSGKSFHVENGKIIF